MDITQEEKDQAITIIKIYKYFVYWHEKVMKESNRYSLSEMIMLFKKLVNNRSTKKKDLNNMITNVF